MDSKLNQETAKLPWALTPHKRAPWIRTGLHLARQVKPLVDQNNPDIPTDAVMRRRDEPVGYSNAFPLNAAGEESNESGPRRHQQDLTHEI